MKPKGHLQDIATITNVLTDVESFAAPPVSNDRNYITDIIVDNNSATDTHVHVKDGTTIICRIPAKADGGAVPIGLRTPLRGSKNAIINVATEDAVTSVFVTMTGYTQR
jgi:hypothetical protein